MSALAAKKVLFIQTAHIGDLVSSLPVVKWMATQAKSTDIIVRSSFVELIENEYGLNVYSEVIDREFDIVIDLDSSSISRKLVKQIKSPCKIGRFQSWMRRIKYSIYYSHQVPKFSRGHIVRDYDPILEYFGEYSSETPTLTAALDAEVTSLADEIRKKYNRIWGIHFKAARYVRDLPEQLVLELIEHFRLSGDAVWLFGRPEDGVEKFQAENVFYRELNLNQLKAAFGVLDALIACESGPAHVANALGVKNVVLFGPTMEEEYGVKSDYQIALSKPLDCRPCDQNKSCPIGKRCLSEISLNEIVSQL